MSKSPQCVRVYTGSQTHPYDRAWEELSAWLRTREPPRIVSAMSSRMHGLPRDAPEIARSE